MPVKTRFVETVEELDEVIKQATTPVLIKFGASWCKPCNQLAPILAEWFREVNTEGTSFKVVGVQVDIDDMDDELQDRYQVTKLPHLVYINRKKEVFKSFHPSTIDFPNIKKNLTTWLAMDQFPEDEDMDDF